MNYYVFSYKIKGSGEVVLSVILEEFGLMIFVFLGRSFLENMVDVFFVFGEVISCGFVGF